MYKEIYSFTFLLSAEFNFRIFEIFEIKDTYLINFASSFCETDKKWYQWKNI